MICLRAVIRISKSSRHFSNLGCICYRDPFFSSPGRSPGRTIVLTPALASALAAASALAKY